jgi:stage V sporulation protein B
MSRESFVKSAAILSISGFIVKILGAVFQIPLINLIGTEGIGYYQPAYNIYNLLLTVSLAGFPTAIAKLVSERRALNNFEGAYQVYKVSRWGLLIIGLISSIFVLFFASKIMNFLGYPGSYYSMVALVPALFVVPILSSYRGFFQGTQNMMPIALSQIVEQIFRVFVGLYLAYMLVNIGLREAAAGATFGASIGAMSALILIYIMFLVNRKNLRKEIETSSHNKKEVTSEIVKEILYIAIPITIGASIGPLMSLMDSYLVSSRLSVIGYSDVQIADLFGQLSGTAQTLINFPQVFSTAVAMSLVPAITDAYTKKQKNRLNSTSNVGIRLALVIGLPCGIGLCLLSEPIIALLFSSLGPEKHASAGALLQIMSISVIFLSVIQAFTAMLQSVDKQFLPVKNLIVGLIVKIILSYLLISMPLINIRGAAFSTTGAYLIILILNWVDVNTKTSIKINFSRLIIKPIISTSIMAIAVWISFKVATPIIGQKLSTLASISFGGIVYVFSLFATGAITSEDLDLIPKGDKLKKFVRKK